MKRYSKIGWIALLFYASLWGAPYTDNGNGTISDSATGLIWQKCTARLGITLGNCSTGSLEMYTWSNAITYCEGLILGSRSDWRLPNINELRSIIDYTKSTRPTVDIIAFPNNRFENYWSSSTYAQNTNFAWYVNFSNGSVDGSLKANNYYVRCVKEINASYENKIESLLAQHLKKNYNKTPKEITIISRMIERILDEVESRGTPISQMEADKIVMWVSKLLSQS